MTVKIRDPRVVLTRHARTRIRQRTNRTPIEVIDEIRAVLATNGCQLEGHGSFVARSFDGERDYALARKRSGTWVVLTVLRGMDRNGV